MATIEQDVPTLETYQDVVDPGSVPAAQQEDEPARPIEVPTGTDMSVFLQTPVDLGTIKLSLSGSDAVGDIHKFLQETTETCLLTSYCLEINGKRMNEFADVKTYPEIKEGSTLDLKPLPYNERSARFHVTRLKDIIGTGEWETNPNNPSLFSYYSYTDENPIEEDAENGNQSNNNNNATSKLKGKKPTQPKTVKKSTAKRQAENEERKKEIVNVDAHQKPELSKYYPTNFNKPIVTLKRIDRSGWAPVPGNRQLVGDLFYLEIELVDVREILFVTASVKGFFVNQSTYHSFNPAISTKYPKTYHDLYELLSKISATFDRGLKSILKRISRRNQYEMIPNPITFNTWIMRPNRPFRYNVSESNESNITILDPEMRGQPRDWNEEFQALRELPRASIAERIMRDRAFYRVNTDFVESAIRGAKLVVSKSIPPINPLEPEKSHMFVYHNIFLSFTLDTRDHYSYCGGDAGARAAANNDLKGVRLFNLIDIEGLSTICTAIVDYRGHRILAQSLVPGILSNERTSEVKYGSMDSGKTIRADPEFAERIEKLSNMLHLSESEVIPSDVASQSEISVKLFTSYESKGIVGLDGRKYILDIMRATPRDPNYKEDKHVLCLLRPELIANYTEYVRVKWEAKVKAEKQAKKEKESKIDAVADQDPSQSAEEEVENKEENQTTTTTTTTTTTSTTTTTTATTTEANGESVEEQPPHILFNPNLLYPSTSLVKLAGDPEKLKKDMETLEAAGLFLKETMINNLIDDFKLFNLTPVDGQTLTQSMHSRGINMRYLGHVTTLCDRIPFAKEVCFNEMVSRASKHIFGNILRETPQSELSAVSCHFLNCLLGTPTVGSNDSNNQNGNTTGSNENSPKLSSNKANTSSSNKKKNELTQTSLWTQIYDLIKEKFDYDIQVRSVPLECRVNVLRSLCLKVGLQINAKDYDFTKDEPFSSDDIVDMVCVVKHIGPRSSDAIELLEGGKTVMAKREYKAAQSYLIEALAFCQQVHGPIHTDTANCFSSLAMVAFYTGNFLDAIEHQKNAIIITEKTLGIDHHDTIHSYTNLALFCQRAGRNLEAIAYLKHVVYLNDLLGSEFNPESSSIYTSAAIILQELKEYDAAIEYLKKCLDNHKHLFGEHHLVSSSTLQTIAQVYSEMKNYAQADHYQKQATAILTRFLGPAHQRTKESQQISAAYQEEMRNDKDAEKKLKALQQQQQQQQKQKQQDKLYKVNKGDVPKNLEDQLKWIGQDDKSKKGKKSK